MTRRGRPPAHTSLPSRIGALNIVRIEGLKTVVSCDAGHESTRNTRKLAYIVRNGLRARCVECPPPASTVQLETIALVASHPGITTALLENIVKKGRQGTIAALIGRGWIADPGGVLFATDAGLAELENSREVEAAE